MDELTAFIWNAKESKKEQFFRAVNSVARRRITRIEYQTKPEKVNVHFQMLLSF